MPQADDPSPYAHWMLREIHEQPAAITASLDRYVADGRFRDDTCGAIRKWLSAVDEKIVVAASGSSRHAAMVAELLIEEASGIAVDVEYASEYTYRSLPLRAAKTGVLVVSQSGETADTLAALRRANAAGQKTLAIANVPDSTMAREASASFPTMAGRERAIPATKSFTAQLTNLYLLSLLAAESRGTLEPDAIHARLKAARNVPQAIATQLAGWEESARQIAAKYMHATSFLFLGRGVHYPIAREGALKVKESSYLHAEGYPSGELKHGPNALVATGTPLVMMATVDRADPGSVERYGRVVQLVEEMRTQGAEILAVANEGDEAISDLANDLFTVRETAESLLPLVEIVPLQMLAYFLAVGNGIDVDRPRNLVKAVTSE